MSTSNKHSKRGSYKPRSEKNYWGVYWLTKAKMGVNEISRLIGISNSTVSDIRKKIEVENTPLPRAPPGASMKISERGLRHIATVAKDDPFMTIEMVRDNLKSVGIDVSRDTTISYLRKVGFKSYYAANKPALTELHMKHRLEWATEHVNWTKDQWTQVI